MRKQNQLALAAAAALSFFGANALAADASVYGRVNMSVETRDGDSAVVSNDSRIGLKGTESLPGGMKVGFQIEHGFNAANGTATGAFWGRQSEVFLGNQAATVRLGNFASQSYYATAEAISLHNNDSGFSADALFGDANRGHTGNRVGLRSQMGPATIDLAVIEGYTDFNGEGRGYDVAVTTTAGGIDLGLGGSKHASAEAYTLRASKQVGTLTVGGYYQRDRNIFGSDGRNTYRASARLKQGMLGYHVNVGHSDDVVGEKADQLTVGVDYEMSKRTTVYALYSKFDMAAAGTQDSSGIGLRHNF